MIAEQAEFNLRQKAARAVNQDSIAELCGLLRGRGWTTCREIQALRPLWNERFIRMLAEASGTIISAPGTPGYLLADETTLFQDAVDAAIAEAIGRNKAQGKAHIRNIVKFRRLAGTRAALRQRMAPRNNPAQQQQP